MAIPKNQKDHDKPVKNKGARKKLNLDGMRLYTPQPGDYRHKDKKKKK